MGSHSPKVFYWEKQPDLFPIIELLIHVHAEFLYIGKIVTCFSYIYDQHELMKNMFWTNLRKTCKKISYGI